MIRAIRIVARNPEIDNCLVDCVSPKIIVAAAFGLRAAITAAKVVIISPPTHSGYLECSITAFFNLLYNLKYLG